MLEYVLGVFRVYSLFFEIYGDKNNLGIYFLLNIIFKKRVILVLFLKNL